METKVLGYNEFLPLAERMLKAVIADKDEGMMASFVVLSGDRITCCDEVVVFANDPELGIVTISSEGEMGDGTPTIVGMYVRPSSRGKSFGTALLAAAVRRCVERGFEKVRIDTLTRASKRAVDKLPDELKARLDVHDMSSFTPF